MGGIKFLNTAHICNFYKKNKYNFETNNNNIRWKLLLKYKRMVLEKFRYSFSGNFQKYRTMEESVAYHESIKSTNKHGILEDTNLIIVRYFDSHTNNGGYTSKNSEYRFAVNDVFSSNVSENGHSTAAEGKVLSVNNNVIRYRNAVTNASSTIFKKGDIIIGLGASRSGAINSLGSKAKILYRTF